MLLKPIAFVPLARRLLSAMGDRDAARFGSSKSIRHVSRSLMQATQVNMPLVGRWPSGHSQGALIRLPPDFEEAFRGDLGGERCSSLD